MAFQPLRPARDLDNFEVAWSWPRNPAAKRFRRYRGKITVRRVGPNSYRYRMRIRRAVFPSKRKVLIIRSSDR